MPGLLAGRRGAGQWIGVQPKLATSSVPASPLSATPATAPSASPPCTTLPNCLQWIAGLEAPEYQEVGPYGFTVTEVRYNIGFSKNWTEVSRGGIGQG